jgi:hypothetical protein
MVIRSMTDTQAVIQESLEPLADYLEPVAGNIYDCDEFDAQPWTESLRVAVNR